MKALDAYTGVYKIDDNNQWIVRREGNQLRMQRTNRPPVLLSTFSSDAFFWPGEPGTFAFSRNAQGQVISMTLQQDGEPQVNPRIGDAPTQRSTVALAPATFDRLVGRYQMTQSLVLELAREGDHYFATGTRQPKIEIFPASETVFFAKVMQAELHVDTDAATGATLLVLHQNGHRLTGHKPP